MTTGLRSQLQLSTVTLAGYFTFCSPGTLSSETGTVQSWEKGTERSQGSGTRGKPEATADPLHPGGTSMRVKHYKSPQQVGLLARGGPECVPQAKFGTGLESDASPGPSMLGGGSFMGRGLPRKWVTCHLSTCRENPGILRKAQAFPKFHFGHAFVCLWLV